MAKDAIQDLRRRANVPNPLESAAPLIALAAIALVLEAAPDLPWEVGVGVAALFGAAAAVRVTQEWRTVRRLRALADQIILRAEAHRIASALVSWRMLELTSRRHRHVVAAEAARLSRELDAATLPGAVPLNRAAVRPYRQELEAIAAALESGEPVSARGVLLVQDLLSSPSSPLYDRAAVGALEPRLNRAISALRA
jgi:hypothetical protein